MSCNQTCQEHRPEAEVRLGEQRVASKAELSAEAVQRLAAILYELARSYAGIWYFCPKARQEPRKRAIGQ